MNKLMILDRVRYLGMEIFKLKLVELMVKEQKSQAKELAQDKNKNGRVKFLMSGVLMAI